MGKVNLMHRTANSILQFLGTWVIRKTPTSFVASVAFSWGVAQVSVPWDFLLKISLQNPYVKELSTTSHWIQFLLIFVVSMAVLQAGRAVILAHSIAPKVDPHFLGDDKCLLLVPLTHTHTGAKVGEAYYVRVRIDNEHYRVAEGISAQLVNIQIKKGDQYQDINFRTPLNLRGGESFPVRKGVPEYVNLFFIKNTEGVVRLESTLNEYENIFSNTGFYKLDIKISEPNASQDISLSFDWRGKFERPRVGVV